MPNWSAGNIRFRGKMKDILKCLKGSLKFCKYEFDEKKNEGRNVEKPAIVKDDYYIITVETPFTEEPEKTWCYISPTHRNFINLNFNGKPNFASAGIFRKDDDSLAIVVFDDFRAAWAVEPDPYVEMSKKYGIDIAIFTWEHGIGFSQKIVIVNGKLKIFEEKSYGNLYEEWMWNSEMPYLGG